MTGEMGWSDIEPGGEWHGTAQGLRRAAIEIGRRTRWALKFEDVRPFDQYQGPYARLRGFGGCIRLWVEEWYSTYGGGLDVPNSRFTLEICWHKSEFATGTPSEIAERVREIVAEQRTAS